MRQERSIQLSVLHSMTGGTEYCAKSLLAAAQMVSNRKKFIPDVYWLQSLLSGPSPPLVFRFSLGQWRRLKLRALHARLNHCHVCRSSTRSTCRLVFKRLLRFQSAFISFFHVALRIVAVCALEWTGIVPDDMTSPITPENRALKSHRLHWICLYMGKLACLSIAN